MAYPTKEMEKLTNGKQSRFVNTDDFLAIAETESGMKLDWFFEVYLRQPKLPKLITEAQGNKFVMRWETPNNLSFTMPINVDINGKSQRIEMPNGTATIDFDGKNLPIIDRKGWVLKAQ